MSSQKIDGAWQGTSKRTRSEQAVSFLDTTSCTTLINYLYTLAIVRGRLPSSNIFSTEFWFRAWPVADPYDTPLRRGPVISFEFSPLSFASVLAGYNTPLLNPPQIVPPAPKALRIEAENAVLKSPLQIADAMGASDKKAVWSPSGLAGFSNAVSETAGLAEVSFKVERPGPHVFWMRVYFHSYGGASFWVRFDDDDWRVLEGGIRGEWQWLRMPSTPTLATGEHRLYFATREAGAVLDAMEISTDLDYVPEEQVGKEIVKPEELRESVPTEPVSVGEHTTFLATFDGAICDADFAKGDRHMGGVQFKLGQVGRFRSSVELKAKEVYLLCSGGPNIPGERGKLSLWFRPLPGSNPFVDGKQHYVFVLKYAPQVVRHVAEERYQIFENTVMLLIKGGAKTMQVYLNDGRRAQTYNVCKIPADGLSPDTWHHLLFAWDYPARWVKLAIDGRGVKQNIPYRFDSSETLGLYLGNALYYNVLKPLGCYVDDLHISSQPD